MVRCRNVAPQKTSKCGPEGLCNIIWNVSFSEGCKLNNENEERNKKKDSMGKANREVSDAINEWNITKVITRLKMETRVSMITTHDMWWHTMHTKASHWHGYIACVALSVKAMLHEKFKLLLLIMRDNRLGNVLMPSRCFKFNTSKQCGDVYRIKKKQHVDTTASFHQCVNVTACLCVPESTVKFSVPLHHIA